MTPAAVALGSLLATAVPCAADPVTLANGRILLGGYASGTYSEHDPNFFNATSYNGSYLRRLRLSLAAEVRAGSRLALVGEIRTDNLDTPRPYALYLRFRPWPSRTIDLQAGRIPLVFGSYPRRGYALDNPLPGMPLAYQYLTSLRSDEPPPLSVADVYARRGGVWHPYGQQPQGSAGLPIVETETWDTGVQVRVGSSPVQLAVAITQGTLSHPETRDDNGGKQLSARLLWRPVTGIALGVSGARGEYVSRDAVNTLPETRRQPLRQQAAAFDVEFSKGYWILRGEALYSTWDVPTLDQAPNVHRLPALAYFLEARYKVAPGFYLAARGDHIGFGIIEAGMYSFRWDAPVTRVEAGGGYLPRPDLLFKMSIQHNRREGGARDNLVAGQVAFWF